MSCCAADGEAPPEAEDLERASRAAYLTGRDDDWLSLAERAFRERMRQGDPEGAALAGFWLAFGLLPRGEWAQAARAAIAHGGLVILDAGRRVGDNRRSHWDLATAGQPS
jgi:uncharacterized protein YbjT (DUF2867 family)